MEELKGRVALGPRASRGIGRAIARRFAAEGKMLSLRTFWEFERSRLGDDIQPRVGRED